MAEKEEEDKEGSDFSEENESAIAEAGNLTPSNGDSPWDEDCTENLHFKSLCIINSPSHSIHQGKKYLRLIPSCKIIRDSLRKMKPSSRPICQSVFSPKGYLIGNRIYKRLEDGFHRSYDRFEPKDDDTLSPMLSPVGRDICDDVGFGSSGKSAESCLDKESIPDPSPAVPVSDTVQENSSCTFETNKTLISDRTDFEAESLSESTSPVLNLQLDTTAPSDSCTESPLVNAPKIKSQPVDSSATSKSMASATSQKANQDKDISPDNTKRHANSGQVSPNNSTEVSRPDLKTVSKIQPPTSPPSSSMQPSLKLTDLSELTPRSPEITDWNVEVSALNTIEEIVWDTDTMNTTRLFQILDHLKLKPDMIELDSNDAFFIASLKQLHNSSLSQDIHSAIALRFMVGQHILADVNYYNEVGHTFFSRRKCSVEAYVKQLEISGTPLAPIDILATARLLNCPFRLIGIKKEWNTSKIVHRPYRTEHMICLIATGNKKLCSTLPSTIPRSRRSSTQQGKEATKATNSSSPSPANTISLLHIIDPPAIKSNTPNSPIVVSDTSLEQIVTPGKTKSPSPDTPPIENCSKPRNIKATSPISGPEGIVLKRIPRCRLSSRRGSKVPNYPSVGIRHYKKQRSVDSVGDTESDTVTESAVESDPMSAIVGADSQGDIEGQQGAFDQDNLSAATSSQTDVACHSQQSLEVSSNTHEENEGRRQTKLLPISTPKRGGYTRARKSSGSKLSPRFSLRSSRTPVRRSPRLSESVTDSDCNQRVLRSSKVKESSDEQVQIKHLQSKVRARKTSKSENPSRDSKATSNDPIIKDLRLREKSMSSPRDYHSSTSYDSADDTNWEQLDTSLYSNDDKEYFLKKSIHTIIKLKKKIRQSNRKLQDTSLSDDQRKPSKRVRSETVASPPDDSHGNTSSQHRSVDRSATNKSCKSTNSSTVHVYATKGHKKKNSSKKAVVFTCTTCNLNFDTQTELDDHINKKHVQKYACRYCPKRYSHYSSLINHESQHKEGPLKCDICDKVYKRKDRLRLHQLTHKGEFKHLCQVCGKSFNKKSIYDAHLAAHNGEKKYKCEKCGKRFQRLHDMQFHLKNQCGKHPRHTCPKCKKTLKTYKYLKVHMKLHEESRPKFKCSKCNKDFVSKVGCDQHMMACKYEPGASDEERS